MPYRITPKVAEENHHRCHFPEVHYIESLKKRGGLIKIDNVLIDAEQLVLRSFQCNTQWCVRCAKEDGLTKYKGSCCTDLEVDLTRHEVSRLAELGRMAGRRLDLPEKSPLRKVVGRLQKDNYTTLTEKGEIAFEHLPKSGRCPMSWVESDGTLRCGINTLCSMMDLPLPEYKPDPCFLFPLHFVEFSPGQLLLTVISRETHQYIGADRYVGKLRCLSKPEPGSPPAYQFLRHEIIYCLNEEFFERLDEAARPLLEREGLLESADAASGNHGSGKTGRRRRKVAAGVE